MCNSMHAIQYEIPSTTIVCNNTVAILIEHKVKNSYNFNFVQFSIKGHHLLHYDTL